MGVLAVVGVLHVALLDRVRDDGRDRLLAVVKMHEATDVALHVLLVARGLELAGKLHHGVRGHEVLLLDLLILGDLETWEDERMRGQN